MWVRNLHESHESKWKICCYLDAAFILIHKSSLCAFSEVPPFDCAYYRVMVILPAQTRAIAVESHWVTYLLVA